MSDHAVNARALRIQDVEINDVSECYVIAEIGHNHQGSVEQARKLFDEAKAAGAHAVKLQKRDNRSLYTRELFNKPYENENSYGATYGEHREASSSAAPSTRSCRRTRAEIGDHVLRHGVRPPERRLPRRARHAGLQDRLGRPDQHAAAAARGARSASR